MAKLIEKVMKGGSLKYIKYKKYFMQRAKIRAEKNSDQYSTVSKRNLRFMHSEWRIRSFYIFKISPKLSIFSGTR